jgi:hypothetical protein
MTDCNGIWKNQGFVYLLLSADNTTKTTGILINFNVHYEELYSFISVVYKTVVITQQEI